MKKTFRWVILPLMLALVLCLTAALPTSMTDMLTDPTTGGTTAVISGDTVTISKEEYEELSKYKEMVEIMGIVKEYYYFDQDEQTMLDYAAAGMLAGLDDPYTFYYTPDAFEEMLKDDEGKYVGIGVMISANYETTQCTIIRVFLDSPALEAGLQKGDILLKVEDLDVCAENLTEAVNIIRGQEGSTVHIQIQRGDEILEKDVMRRAVQVNYVSSCMLDGNIGYISLYQFSGECSTEFKKHLQNLVDNGAEALILDLRDNPGGNIEDGRSIADLFLDKGLLTKLVYRDGSEENYRTSTDGKENKLPLFVLVNENSASCSELLSGALQDRDRAEIIGTQTFGKGIVQWVLNIGTRGAGMQLTIAQYFTPNGNTVHKVGITPDVVVEMPEDAENAMYELGDLNDVQLKAAYDLALETLNKK